MTISTILFPIRWTPAGTSFFDFRNAGLYGDCNDSGSCTKSEPLADGRNVTISASNPNTLYRDNADGFGIRGNENDEVDADEVLTIAFQGGWIPTFLGITDLFKSGDGNDDGEEVVLRGFLDDVLVFDLKGNAHDGINGGWALGSGNGEIVFRLPGVEIDFLEFHSVEASDLGNESNDEFSVALIAGQAPSEVPEPGCAGPVRDSIARPGPADASSQAGLIAPAVFNSRLPASRFAGGINCRPLPIGT